MKVWEQLGKRTTTRMPDPLLWAFAYMTDICRKVRQAYEELIEGVRLRLESSKRKRDR